MVNITVPPLRQASGTSHTVPVGETWVIKVVSGIAKITTTINSLTYSLYDHNLVTFNDIKKNGGVFPRSLILNAGDSIAGTSSISIGYWILEIDFDINRTIPDLRKTSISVPGAGTTVTLTVPAGETWVVKIANAALSRTGNVLSRTYSVNAVLDGNTYTDLWKVINSSSASSTYSIISSIFDDSVMLNPGDTITLLISGTIGGESFSLDVGYWILEQDF